MIKMDSQSILALEKEKEEALKPKTETKKNDGFDFNELQKHYLNTIIPEGKRESLKTIRILPFTETEAVPFKKIHIHNVKVLDKNGKKRWQKFMCPIETGKDTKCPFCEVAEGAKEKFFEEKKRQKDAGIEDKKTLDSINNIQFMYEKKPYWFVRCIDRDHEDEGVKYWRFADSRKCKGIFDDLKNIWKLRLKKGTDIYDLYRGKDIIITISKDKDDKSVYNCQDDEAISPLSQSEDEMVKWVYDKEWTCDKVFPTKPYDFLSILVKDDYPIWDKDEKKYLGKKEIAKELEKAKIEEQIENAQPQDNNFSRFLIDTGSTESNASTDNNLPY